MSWEVTFNAHKSYDSSKSTDIMDVANVIKHVSAKELSTVKKSKCHILIPYKMVSSGCWKSKPSKISSKMLFGPASLRTEKVVIYPCVRNRCNVYCPCFICQLVDLQKKSKKELFEDHDVHHKASHIKCIFCEELLKIFPAFNNRMCLSQNIPLEVRICTRRLKPYKFKHSYGVDESSESEQLTCEICRSEFTCYESLIRHRDSIHFKECLTCELCNEKFTRADNMKRHADEVHGENCYQCEHCNKTFRNHSSFKKHKKSNFDAEGNSKFKCEICGSEACNSKVLKLHLRLAHKFECIYCKESFAKKSNLMVHNKNNKVSCDLCSSQFCNQKKLLGHIASEHKEIYNCTECGKEFKTKFNLQRHVTGASCRECNLVFCIKKEKASHTCKKP